MTVTDMSSAHQNAVHIVLKGSENVMGGNGCRTHHPHGYDIGRVFQPGYPGQIGCPIGTPVTHKGNNFGFKYICFHWIDSFIIYAPMALLIWA
jgi:hypothetical protein